MRERDNRTVLLSLLAWGGLCLLPSVGSAAAFHVSPFGSNTPPYDTYAKAAHRIADAVAFADSGDTVLIGAGTYAVDSTIILARSFITVRGAGRDSTFILAESHVEFCFFASGYDYSPDFGFQFADLSVQGGPLTTLFFIIGRYGYPGVNEVAFRHCRFVGEGQCIEPTECPLRVEECLFEYYVQGVAAWGKGPYTIRNNVFISDYLAIAIEFKPDGEGPITIDHNTVLGGASTTFLSANHCTDMTVSNNYVDVGAGAIYSSGGGIQIVNNFIAGGTKPGTDPYNRPEREVMVFYPDASQRITCENNSIIAHRPGTIIMVGPRWATGYVDFRYNSLWGFRPDSQVPIHINQPTPEEPRRLVVDTTGLIWADPMLTPDSSGALLPESPLIDAGNPAILDADGSRSDIGLFGGPGGDFRYIDWRHPGTPDGLQGETLSGGFRLTWKPNPEPDLAGYRIYIDTRWEFDPDRAARIIHIPPQSTSFLDTLRPKLGRDGRGFWFYKLTAVDTAGFQSPLTDDNVYWLVDTLPPAAPDSLRGDTTGNGFRLSWKWNSEIDVVGYRVYSDPAEGFLIDHANRVVAVPWNKHEFLDTTRLTPGSAARFYKVTAVDKAGLESQPSNEVRWSVADRSLQAPALLQGYRVAEGFRLSWRPNPEPYLAGYLVYSDSTPSFPLENADRLSHLPRDSTGFLDTLRPAPGARYYKVTAIDSTALESSPSIEVAWTPSTDRGVPPDEPSITTAYPNPFNSTVIIEYGLPDAGARPAQVAIRIYNMLGQLVKVLYNGNRSPGRYEVSWDGRDSSGAVVSSGAYFVRLDYWGRQTRAYKVVLLK